MCHIDLLELERESFCKQCLPASLKFVFILSLRFTINIIHKWDEYWLLFMVQRQTTYQMNQNNVDADLLNLYATILTLTDKIGLYQMPLLYILSECHSNHSTDYLLHLVIYMLVQIYLNNETMAQKHEMASTKLIFLWITTQFFLSCLYDYKSLFMMTKWKLQISLIF